MSTIKILLIRAGALGDTLMLMPAISHLRKKEQIILAGRYPGIDYLRPYVDGCIDLESSGWHGLFMERAGHPGPSIPIPDHVVAFLTDPEGNVLKNLKAWFPSASINIFPVFPPEENNIHIALYMAQSIEAAGIPIDPCRCIEDSLKMPIMADRHPFPRNSGIVLHPGSGSRDKNYPPELWIEIINRLKDRYPDRSKRIIILLGPAEEGIQSFFREAVNQMDARLIYYPEREALIDLMGQASLYIGHDSGVTHLAAMMGAPVIAIFRKSSPEQWRPLGPAVRIIRDIKEAWKF
jgi:ADP-heptose:LPS heptosyltransferase